MRPASRLLFALSFLLALPAQALGLSWTGTVEVVATDAGTSVFSGLGIGTKVAASSDFPAVCGAGCSADLPEPNEQNYALAGFPGSLDLGGILNNAVDGNLNIQNDYTLDAGELALAAALGIVIAPGTQVDVWTVGSATAGDLIEWDVALVSLDTTLLSDFSYVGAVPDPARIDFAIFSILEQDVLENPLYEGFGIATLVPEPAAATLLVTAIAAGVARRRRTRR